MSNEKIVNLDPLDSFIIAPPSIFNLNYDLWWSHRS